MSATVRSATELAAKPGPQDASALLLQWQRIKGACDFFGNRAFAQADQRTRAYDGDRLVDAARSKDVLLWATELLDFVQLPPLEFKQRVPLLAGKQFPKRKTPSDADAGWDAIGAGPADPLSKKPEMRDIVVPCAFRRMLSNVFTSILIDTADHLLPKEAWAYRPHHPDVVQRGIMKAARALVGGCVYWAKLDVKDFFRSVPWTGIEAALRRYEFQEDFIQKLMALVQGKIVAKHGWRGWVTVENGSGTQAGLRESAILANLFLAGLDELIKDTFGKDVFYLRYSDDILIMSKSRSVVIGAVKLVRQWTKEQGLYLKDVPPTKATHSLVHNVKTKRVEFLGAEINGKGRVRLPKAKADAFRAKLAHRTKYTKWTGPVVGTSAYAEYVLDGRRGRYRFDPSDVYRAVRGFERHWTRLGAHEVEGVVADVLLELGVDPAGVEADMKYPWIAYLGAPQGAKRSARPGGLGDRVEEEDPVEAMEALSAQEVRAVFADDPYQDERSRKEELDGGEQPTDGRERSEAPSGQRWTRGLPRSVEGRSTETEGVDDAKLEGSSPLREEPEELSEERRSTQDRKHAYACQRERDALVPNGSEEPGGRGEDEEGFDAEVGADDRLGISVDAEDLSFHPAPPDPRSRYGAASSGCSSEDAIPRVPRKRSLYLDHRYVPTARATLLGYLSRDHGFGWRARIGHEQHGKRFESALVRLIHREVVNASRDGFDILVVRMSNARVAKMLVQAVRAIRSVGLFDEVLRLHVAVRDERAHVIVGGPVVPPAALRDMLDLHVRRLTARQHHGRHPAHSQAV